MAGALYKLSAAKVRTAGPGKHSDGGGLYLYRLASGDQWVFRFTISGKRKEMGLGGYPGVTLAQAREQADVYRAIAKNGGNPIEVRNSEKAQAAADQIANDPKAREKRLLKNIAPEAFKARQAQLKDNGVAGRWYSPIKTHILPALGDKPVEDITGTAIADALRPIWHTKTDVARKALTRLKACLSYASAKKYEIDRHAIDDARELLGKQVHKAENIPSMDWRDVPAFYQSLEGGGTVQLALQLLILTGLRSKPIRFARADQIDGFVWTVPAELVKGPRGKTDDFRVPLSAEAIRIVELAEKTARDGFLFPGVRKGVISDASMSRHMERLELAARPHGFRSSFRTWADEATSTDYEVKETAIGHKVGSAVSRAYQRSDYFDERLLLAERWAAHVTGKQAEIIQFHGSTNQ
ncbi:integrase arm-type DNA-binding domain-containing protein [Ruegeria sp. SCSIO 43209]|uniref:tyrosine-type recombinase/integrase n=1 Tax=Ruegeria sp. SCSIO 43209 TaxID=2793010 RepID=UPI001CA94D4A|nr:site-specific integrase [Ruegeria sp. SCSIO 43209]UAB89715.1 integrase arm-type DNA-binding domain-containing protein [Ruegeria sp. SCSIO 43209]